MNIKKTVFVYFISIIALAASFGTGFLLHGKLYPTSAHFPVLSEAYELILDHGYDTPPDPPEMEYGAVHGMVGAYGDPHTRFVEPAQAEIDTDQLTGSYGGIGAQMSRDTDGFVVLHPYPESPASEAGIMDGDRLIKVDDIEIKPDTSMSDVVASVRGPEGENVFLIITRPPNFTEMEFSVQRAEIPLPSVTYHLDATETRLGMVSVNIIASSTPTEIQEAVTNLQSRGATHFTLDLRSNGGGLLIEGVDIARLFLTEGIVIHQQYRGEDVETFEVEKPGPLKDIPLAVLVDQYTASAAEIISGALQNHKRAPLIGVHTFGKDSIQLVFDLQDNSSLHVTSANWWIPGLEPPVGEGGLQPDIAVSTENVGEDDPYLEAAIQYFFGE